MFTYISYYYLIFLVDQAPNRMPFTLLQKPFKVVFFKNTYLLASSWQSAQVTAIGT